MKLRIPAIIAAAFLVLAAAGCTSGAGSSAARLDTPSRHVTNGLMLLENQKTDAALREFRRAIELDAAYSPAYVGLGLAYGHQGDLKKGFSQLQTAQKYARNQDQKRQVKEAYQRLGAMNRGQGHD